MSVMLLQELGDSAFLLSTAEHELPFHSTATGSSLGQQRRERKQQPGNMHRGGEKRS